MCVLLKGEVPIQLLVIAAELVEAFMPAPVVIPVARAWPCVRCALFLRVQQFAAVGDDSAAEAILAEALNLRVQHAERRVEDFHVSPVVALEFVHCVVLNSRRLVGECQMRRHLHSLVVYAA